MEHERERCVDRGFATLNQNSFQRALILLHAGHMHLSADPVVYKDVNRL